MRNTWPAPFTEPQRLVVEAETIGRKTLRRVARHLSDMTNEYVGSPSTGAFKIMVRRYAEDQVASLPEDGDAEQVLAWAMRVPEETLEACLQVARQRLAQ